MSTINAAERRAKKVLDTLAEDEAAWNAMTSLLNVRSLRDTLVEFRKARGLTQKDVAKAMGVGQQTVSVFERARYPDPQLTTLSRYARAVGCRLDFGVIPPVEEPE